MKAALALRDDLLNRAGARLSGGSAKFYTGAQPAAPEDAVGGTLVVTCAISSYSESAGYLSIVLASGTVANTGTPTFARFFQSDGTTVEFDATVGSDINLSKDDWTAAETFTGFTYQVNLPVGT